MAIAQGTRRGPGNPSSQSSTPKYQNTKNTNRSYKQYLDLYLAKALPKKGAPCIHSFQTSAASASSSKKKSPKEIKRRRKPTR